MIIGLVFNTILMNLINSNQYDTIDENMSYSNMGSQKNKGTNIQNFIINAVLNEAAQLNNINLELLVLDYQECFDLLNLSSCLPDLAQISAIDFTWKRTNLFAKISFLIAGVAERRQNLAASRHNSYW